MHALYGPLSEHRNEYLALLTTKGVVMFGYLVSLTHDSLTLRQYEPENGAYTGEVCLPLDYIYQARWGGLFLQRTRAQIEYYMDEPKSLVGAKGREHGGDTSGPDLI